jgi:hypothetical protein
VAIDQNHPPASAPQVSASAIENELPAYRAVSKAAIFSLIFGILALLSFANTMFIAAAVIAVALGLSAERKIQRHPDTWTGRGLARLGTALGLIFGLSALSIGIVQSQIRHREAEKFARALPDVLKNGSIEQFLYYKVPPSTRETKSEAEVMEQVQKSRPDPNNAQAIMKDRYQLGPIVELKDRLALPNETFRFEKIEKDGVEGLTPWAAALYKIEGPGNQNYPKKEEYTLLIIKQDPSSPRAGWWIDHVAYPYQPSSYVPPVKVPDDGHGHGGGGEGGAPGGQGAPQGEHGHPH